MAEATPFIVFLLLPIIWIVGMVKPKLFSFALKNKANRKWITLIIFLLFFVDIIMIGILAPESNHSKSNQNVSTVTETNEIETNKNEEINYEIVKIEDMSHKALGDRSLSDYSLSEVNNLPTDKKISYKVVVGDKITTAKVKPTIDKIISDLTNQDGDIDEIILNLYSDKESINGMYDVASAIWAPGGELGNVNANIARSNNRSGYKTTIQIKDNLEEYLAQKSKNEDKFGLTESQRRQFFKEIVAAEDRAHKEADKKYSSDTYDGMVKNQEEYSRLADIYRGQVMKKYGVDKDQEATIVSEAFKENWPMD